MTRTATPDHIRWLRAVFKERGQKNALAPLTGQDAKALAVFAAALNLYCYADSTGLKSAKQAMVAAATAMQPSTRWIAKRLIPWALDWNDEERLWEQLFPHINASECIRCGAPPPSKDVLYNGICGYCEADVMNNKRRAEQA